MPEVRLDFTVPTIVPKHLPVLALRRGVLLPAAILPLSVGRRRSLAALQGAKGDLILVAAQRDAVDDPSPSDLLPIATLARVIRSETDKRGVRQVVVQGLARVQLTGFPSTHPALEASFNLISEAWPDSVDAEALGLTLRETASEVAERVGQAGNARGFVSQDVPLPLLIDGCASLMNVEPDWKKSVLQTSDPVARAEAVLAQLTRMREVLDARKSIQERVQSETQQHQKEYLLRQQLKAIQEELGEGDESDDLTRLRLRLDEADLPEEVRSVTDRELKRLERINPQSPERSVAVDWLEWVADFPWNTESAVDVDLDALEHALDTSHHGLAEVKRQVVEHLAVRKLAGRGRADVLLLVGPPGVGKTSIASAIADATGRSLVRVALGGMRDEAELRGHRRTYIGARPGRLVEGLRKAGTIDPVVLLDEVDKVSSGRWGNPSAALLEVLDPEQNHHFIDHYLEVPVDLSRALFIATANDLGSIPAALRDRMEVLRIEGYSPSEKKTIARNHLLPRLAENAGISPESVVLTDDALTDAIAGWTQEAGVRQLQRVLGKVFRAVAVQEARGKLDGPIAVDAPDLPDYLGRRKVRDERHEASSQPGIATGLAWTPVGGDVLYIEASTLPGKGRLHLTGQLGDVMKESARAALTYVLANAERFDIPLDILETHDVHIHVPAGGVPKDGPSAGVTMFTALASLLSGRPVRSDLAMTGEASLRGRVLPVGGIESKVLAAHRKGIKRLVLPRRNEADLDDVPAEVLADLDIVLVDHMREVLDAALSDAVAVAEDTRLGQAVA
ncbi:MAG: endopeptidase La [Myxococcota bacterium]